MTALLGRFTPNVQGAIWMTLCGLGFSMMASMVKLASRDLSGFEIAFFRALFGFVTLAPFIARRGLGALRTRHLGMHMWRGLLGIFSMICAYYGISKLALSFPLALWFWRWPTIGDWLLLMGIGASGALSQYWWILAFRAGEASAVAPFDYLRLLFAGAIGIVFFTEFPDLWTYLGAAIIVGSTIYIAQREARLKHSERPDAVKSEAMAAERPEA